MNFSIASSEVNPIAALNSFSLALMPTSRTSSKPTKPKFIIHGEADELIPLKEVRAFYAQLADPKELVEIDRANHLFDGQAGEVGEALEDLLADFSCRTQ